MCLKQWLRRSLARRTAVVAGSVSAALAAVVGLVIVGAVLGNEARELRSRVAVVAILAGALTVFAVVCTVWLTLRRLLGAPLGELSRTMAAAEQGNFLTRARTDRSDELGDLARQFNRMLAKITDLQVESVDDRRELSHTRQELEMKAELEARLRELTLLFEITKTINSQLEFAEVLRAITQKASQALGLEEFAILIMEDDGARLRVRATFGFPKEAEIEGMEFSPGEGISGIVARSGEPCLIADTSKDDRYLHYKGRHMVDGSFLCVPIRYQERLIGLFNVLRPRSGDSGGFTPDDIRLLTSLANAAALALANAQMVERLRELSTHDELTGLANRRLFTQRIETEFERAQRYGGVLSVLMVDIDHFKDWNDTHGHPAGDDVLRKVATLLRGSVRAVDLVARWGGEEFVVMLPGTSKKDALAVGEKMRAACEAAPFSYPAQNGAEAGEGRVTLSVGVAVYPDDGKSVAAVLDGSDRALFQAKRAGRNQVLGAEAKGAPKAGMDAPFTSG